MGPVAEEMEKRLRAHFSPTALVVRDDSEMHRGHAGHDARGESHFTLIIASAAFEGLSRVARQRAVNRVLADLLESRVHALAMQCRTPTEARVELHG